MRQGLCLVMMVFSFIVQAESTVHEITIDQQIDHANPFQGTFKQRVWIDESFASDTNAPVFLLLCGEGPCSAGELERSIRYFAKMHHAKLIALEHRYYGKSIPTATLSTNDLRYLTTENILKDIANTQKIMAAQYDWHGKWIVFGTSYAGGLAAIYRAHYPDLVSGAVSSSAPVKAVEYFDQYDAFTADLAGPQCGNLVRQAIQDIEASIDTPEQMVVIKKQFGASAIQDNLDFLFLLSQVTSGAFQYGYDSMLCSIIKRGKTPMQGYANFINFALQFTSIDPVYLTPQGLKSENPEDYTQVAFSRPWYYQTCTDYGYWLTVNEESSRSLRSGRMNQAYFKQVCQDLFGITTPANTRQLNEGYFQKLQDESVSNIFFINGDRDPWSLLSLTQQNGGDTNPNLTYFMIAGGSHGSDKSYPKSTDSDSLKEARIVLNKLLERWLANAI